MISGLNAVIGAGLLVEVKFDSASPHHSAGVSCNAANAGFILPMQ
jgi:hypothetical protein